VAFGKWSDDDSACWLTAAGKREWPDTKVLVLTHLTGDATRRDAFEKGADAFLDKRDKASALVPAIWDACGAERPRPGRR
jgi:DNA-binding NarL/FixJ family response regulator